MSARSEPRRRLPLAIALGATLYALACREAAPPSAEPPSAEPPAPLVFADATAESGIDFVHDNGRSPRRYLPETMGAGLAVIDADGDGRYDLFFVDSGAVERGGARRPGDLYRNLGGMRFEAVGPRSGLTAPILGQGAAAGDVDNDGDADLLVTGVGADHLYLNRGDGSFRLADPEAGLPEPGFSTSAAFVDVDRDGWLDLFLGRYITWDAAHDVACSPDGVNRTYCTPEVYQGAASRLLVNNGDGTFRDATEAAGVYRPDGKALGVVPIDADADGWPDLVVANDTIGNFLFVNQGDGTFREVGAELGVALGPSGAPRGSMGIDAGDVDGDGRPDLLVANFAQEMSALFVSSDAGVWSDGAAALGLGLPSLMTLAFGAVLADLDLDGSLDAVLANGHIEPEIERYQVTQSYAQPLGVFHGGPGGLVELPAAGRPAGDLIGRGLAVADLDGDGDLDLVVTQNGGPPRILENVSPLGAWLRLLPRGTESNRSGYGIALTVSLGERRLSHSLVSGRSYLTACEPVATLGTGTERAEWLEVRWPSGRRQRFQGPPDRRLLIVAEPLARD